MVSQYGNFSSYNYFPYKDFLHGHILFHLDNPDPVERETRSIQIQKNRNTRPDWTPKSGSCIPLTLIHTSEF